MRGQTPPKLNWIFFLLGVSPLLCCTGCAVLYQLAYGDGHKIDAKYTGLENRRVAVVCVMNPSTYGDGATSTLIADNTERVLQTHVEGIDVVPQSEVADWMDTNNWDESDFVEIGRGVKADMVVAIDVDSFSLHEGPGLFKGRAEVTTTVYDLTRDGKEVFRTTDHQFTFPETHPVHASADMARAFPRTFIRVLSEHLAKNFYAYNLHEEFALDGAAYAH